MEDKTRLVVVDGHNIFYRAYFGIKQPLTHNGIQTGGIFGTINSLSTLVKHHRPTHLIVVFDKGKSRFRLRIYPEYKAGRHDKELDYDPAEVHSQLDWTIRLIEALGISTWREEGVEADDIISAVLKRCAGSRTMIISGDKDLKQLISTNVSLYHPSLGNKPEIKWDYDRVVRQYGVFPENLPDLWALCGDKSDNIPGVPRVGEKTAIKLIAKHGGLDALLASEEPKVSGHEKTVKRNRELIQIYPHLSSFNMPLDDLGFNPILPNTGSDDAVNNLKWFFHQLGLDSILDQWSRGTLWSERGKRLADMQS